MQNLYLYIFILKIINCTLSCCGMKNIKQQSYQDNDDRNILYLFCKRCKENEQWPAIEGVLRNYENKTQQNLHPKILLSTKFAEAKANFSVKFFPVFVFFDKLNNKSFNYELKKQPINQTDLESWLLKTTTEIEAYKVRYYLTENTIFSAIKANYNENETNFVSLVLLKNLRAEEERCKQYDIKFLLEFQKMYNKEENNSKLSVFLMDINKNYAFLRNILKHDLHDLECPTILKIVELSFEVFNGSAFAQNRRLFEENLSNFTKLPLGNETANSLLPIGKMIVFPYNFPIKEADESLLDTYTEGQNEINEKLRDKTFTAIGITGGLSVIALAVSIFWGLKSSSFETKRLTI